MKDASKYQLHRELAREEFRCSQSAQNPYLRDAAQYFYGSDLFNSLKTNDDVLQSGPDVAARMNELAAMTQFVDIKRLALKLRDLAKQAVQESHDAGYGTPQPSTIAGFNPLAISANSSGKIAVDSKGGFYSRGYGMFLTIAITFRNKRNYLRRFEGAIYEAY